MLDGVAAKLAAGTITGSGEIGAANRNLSAEVRADIPDLAVLAPLLGRRLSGTLRVAATLTQPRRGALTARLHSTITGLTFGVAAADALLGGRLRAAATVRRGTDGQIVLDRLSLDGDDLKLAGQSSYDPAHRSLTADLTAALPRLHDLDKSLGQPLAGALTARLRASGPLDHLRLTATIDGNRVALGARQLDRLHLQIAAADLAQRQATIAGDFRVAGIGGTVALAAGLAPDGRIDVPHLHLAALDSTVDGHLRIDPARRLVVGSLDGTMPRLARWSRLFGLPLAGAISVKAKLAARHGQDIDVAIEGRRLAVSGAAIGRLTIDATGRDLLGAPSGTARIRLADAHVAGGDITHLNARVTSRMGQRFAFTSDLRGRMPGALALTLAGEVGLLRGGGVEARLTRLDGTAGGEKLALEHPVALSYQGRDVALNGLDLRLGAGRIAGSFARRGDAIALRVASERLALAPLARFAGHAGLGGTLALTVTVGGTIAAPRGRLMIDASSLHFTGPGEAQINGLALALNGEWNGRALAIAGHIDAAHGQRLSLAGSLPVVLTAAPFGLSVPARDRLALRVKGTGDLADLTELLPLGEGQLSGRFALDLGLAGTVAKPVSSGQLTIAAGRYANSATGVVVQNIAAEIAGDGNRLTLRRFSAGDGEGGKLTAEGDILLAGTNGPTAALRATLTKFRVTSRDEGAATASGTVAIAGTLTAPAVNARLTLDKADLALPASLPPEVVTLKVVTINSRTGRKPLEKEPAAAPAMPVKLDVTVDLPGNLFVRGHGLDSQWRGRLSVTGTSTAPRIRGSLNALRGTFQFLGKSFQISRGTISFDGSERLDPALDIVAEISAADITAQVHIGGYASSPQVKLTSTPSLPQGEILARVLFGGSLSQISVGEGAQVAEAAAALAGGGPGVLDRLRKGLGLDVLGFGKAPTGIASSSLNPSTSATSDPAISGGKYVMPGVFVGASQGLTPQSSQVTVQITVRPHVTVETDLGETGDSGIGVNYSYDY
jgi:translocation and assembly module TamB